MPQNLTNEKLNQRLNELEQEISVLRDMKSHLQNTNDLPKEKPINVINSELNILQEVIDGARNIHLVFLDWNFNFVRVNNFYAETCGYTPEEMIGKNHFDLFPNPENEAIFTRTRNTGIPFEIKDKPFSFPDQPNRGVTYWDWSLVPVKDPDGTVTGLVFSLVETTDRVLMEKSLRKSEERYSAMFENMSSGAAVYESIEDGKDFIFKSFNRSAEKITNISRDQVLGNQLLALFPNIDRTGLTDALRRVWKTGKAEHLPPFYRKDKIREGWRENQIYKIPTGEIVALFDDVTNRIEAQIALKKAHDELEQRVEERTFELEKLNRELQDFVFIASHDLREPLRKLIIFGRIILEKIEPLLDDTMRDYTERMQKAVLRMQALLDSLMNYSRITTQYNPLNETNLKLSVESALSNLEIMVSERKARVEVGDLPIVKADRIQMVQLFQNLIANALKYNKDIPHVRIFSRSSERNKKVFDIHVADNGIGIDEPYLEQIFFPFERLHGRTEYDGTGIGLSICRKIADRHGGKITVKSELGKGSEFIVTIPA